MRTVLDCNVIISSGLTDGLCRKLLLYVIENEENFISDEIIKECREVIKRPKFYNHQKYLFELFVLICKNSKWIRFERFNYYLPDRDDEIYLNTALSCRANFLITGNIKDYPKNIYDKLRIITPKEYLIISNIY